MIQSVMAEDVPEVWPQVEKYIVNACKHGDGVLHPDEVLSALIEKKMQLFVCDGLKGALVTEIRKGRDRTTLRGVAIGGELWAWDFGELNEIMQKWANELGAKMEIVGRKGWSRVLRKYGWKQKSIIMEV